MIGAIEAPRPGGMDELALPPAAAFRTLYRRRRVAAGIAFSFLSLAACVLVARRLSHASWPLEGAHVPLVFLAGGAYLASFGFRAFGWQRLFPRARSAGGCFPGRATSSSPVGVGFSPTLALVVLCMSGARSILPITAGGAVAGMGTTAGLLFALGVTTAAAVNFALASGLLLTGAALAAAALGLGGSLLFTLRARRPLSAWAVQWADTRDEYRSRNPRLPYPSGREVRAFMATDCQWQS